MDFDVLIIGSGVVGCAVARYLSRYDARICVVEKEEDVCSGTSKANSGIVHAGFDAMPGSMMAKMNVRGSALVKKLSSDLDFPYKNNGALVLCFSRDDLGSLNRLYERGLANGVKGLEILTPEQIHEKEPAVSKEVAGALWAGSSAIVCPFSMTIALAENAAANGAQFRFLEHVDNINKTESGFEVVTDKGKLTAKCVVNCAGVYADSFHNMLCKNKIHITPRRGEYVLLDKEAGDLVSSTVFQLPTKLGKGVLVTPTVHGNLLIGPNAQDLDDKEDVRTTKSGTDDIEAKALLSVPSVPLKKMITGFAGLRAHEDGADFIIGEAGDCPGFFEAAGIESPGLSSAPAIGEYLSDLIAQKYGFDKKKVFVGKRKGFRVGDGPEYRNIICRCEGISEGEILDAIHRNPGAKSLDGIKRRVRQGMGRCQAGFCTPKAIAILARELGISETEVTKNRPGSEVLKG